MKHSNMPEALVAVEELNAELYEIDDSTEFLVFHSSGNFEAVVFKDEALWDTEADGYCPVDHEDKSIPLKTFIRRRLIERLERGYAMALILKNRGA